MRGFDRRKRDEACASLLENRPDQMATSHQIKRMFFRFAFVGQMTFRSILFQMFIRRLRVEKPKQIILFGDTVVFDNDDAEKRQGAKPTYKKKKGVQPMQISWGPYVVDALFRAGDVHCNHGTDFMKAIGRLIKAIRTRYNDVPIILPTDSGFMDDQNFRFFEERLRIHYVCAGKLYDDIKQVDVLPVFSYPNTFRRVMIDFAAKIVTTGGIIILKVTQAIYDTLNIPEIWEIIGKQKSIFVT